MAGDQLSSVQHIVQLMLENRSFDHMLGFLYPGKTGPNGVPFEGLTGTESNLDGSGNAVSVHQIDTTRPGAYFMPGADQGEGYANTNSQLFGSGKPPSPPSASNSGFVTNFAAAITYDQEVHRTVLAGPTCEVSHLQQLHARMVSDLAVPDDQIIGKPLLHNQQTPADFANYISARTNTWKAARAAGQAPTGHTNHSRGTTSGGGSAGS